MSGERFRSRRRRAIPRIVIAGAGIAGLEALLALRERLDGSGPTQLVDRSPYFVYEPLTVLDAFGETRTTRLALAPLAAEHGAELHVDALVGVDAARRRVRLASGAELAYAALVVAIGADRVPAVPGALTFRGAEDVAELRALLSSLRDGALGHVAFVAPAQTTWTLPLYELALLTEHWLDGAARVSLVTAERAPLERFGAAAGERVGALLAERGIDCHVGCAAQTFAGGVLRCAGEQFTVDAVVAAPAARGRVVDGLPHDADGFLPVDAHGRVRGRRSVYACGAITGLPLKQGSIAAEQADHVAATLAADFGFGAQVSEFQPVLRARLLTGAEPLTLRTVVGVPDEGRVAIEPLWWPPTQVAAPRLGPLLARLEHDALQVTP